MLVMLLETSQIKRAVLYHEEGHNRVFNQDISQPYFVTECIAFIIILFNFFWRWALIKLVGVEWEIERCKDKHCTNGGRVAT